jgi:hypothetical protein
MAEIQTQKQKDTLFLRLSPKTKFKLTMLKVYENKPINKIIEDLVDKYYEDAKKKYNIP